MHARWTAWYRKHPSKAQLSLHFDGNRFFFLNGQPRFYSLYVNTKTVVAVDNTTDLVRVANVTPAQPTVLIAFQFRQRGNTIQLLVLLPMCSTWFSVYSRIRHPCRSKSMWLFWRFYKILPCTVEKKCCNYLFLFSFLVVDLVADE